LDGYHQKPNTSKFWQRWEEIRPLYIVGGKENSVGTGENAMLLLQKVTRRTII
jgi:hypothetical protein